MIAALSAARRYVAIGLVAALLLALGWGARVDHLRAGYRAALDRVVVALDATTGRKNTAAGAPVAIEAVGLLRDRYRAERNEARAIVDRQTASIRAIGAETERQRRIGEENRKLAAATARQRDEWIRRAQAAETRTERLTAEAELEECNAVLDALYRDGF